MRIEIAIWPAIQTLRQDNLGPVAKLCDHVSLVGVNRTFGAMSWLIGVRTRGHIWCFAFSSNKLYIQGFGALLDDLDESIGGFIVIPRELDNS